MDVSKSKTNTYVVFAEEPAYERLQIMLLDGEERCWIDNYMDYNEKGQLPEDEAQAKLIKKRSPRFVVMHEVLYRRSFTKPLLRCVYPKVKLPGFRAAAKAVVFRGWFVSETSLSL